MSIDSERGDGWVTPNNPCRPWKARRKILTTPLSPSSENRLLHSRRKPFGTPLLEITDDIDNFVRDPWFSGDSTSHLFIPETQQQQYIVKPNIKRHNKQRCFSDDVLQLSRNLCYYQQKVMLRKRSMSTIDIVIPPKRIKIHARNPSFSQLHPKYPNPNPQLHCCNCKMSNNYCEHQYSCNRAFKEDQLKIEMPPLSQAIMPPPFIPPPIPTRTSPSLVIPPYTIARVVADKETLKNYSGSTSSPNDRSRAFPWDEWKTYHYSDIALLCILTSGKGLVPVLMIETEDNVFIKYVSLKGKDKDKEFSPRTISSSQKGSSTVVDILKFPVTLPFRIISGAVKWLTG